MDPKLIVFALLLVAASAQDRAVEDVSMDLIDQLDSSEDNVLSEAEFKAIALAAGPEGVSEEFVENMLGIDKDMAIGLVRNFDGNGDHVLNVEELGAIFSAVNVDGNDVLNNDELVAFGKAFRARRH